MSEVQWSPVQVEIGSQLHHLRPDHYRPGADVGFAPVDDNGVLVLVVPSSTLAVVSYCPGPDLYSVVVCDATPHVREYDGVFCDQIGELVYGADSSPWRLPFGAIVTGEDGNATVVEF